MSNRDRHRQGLIYGPVRPSGPRDRGRILGNLLGLLVVGVTVGILVVAIYLFLQSRAAEPTPPEVTPTPAASAVVVESVAPSVEPSPTTVAVASITPTPALSSSSPTAPPPNSATPAPTLFVPPVMAGPGFITFGTIADSQLHVTDPKTTFAIDEAMVWSAYLTQTANSSDLRIRILKMDPSQPTGQRLLREDLVKPDVVGAQIFFRRLRPVGLSDGAGLYTIQYVLGDQVLSTGSFLVQ